MIAVISSALVLQIGFQGSSFCVVSLTKEYVMVCFAWESKLISLGCFYIFLLRTHPKKILSENVHECSSAA